MAKENKPLSVYEEACKVLLEKAGADLKKAPGGSRAMQLAVFRWWADEMGLTKPEDAEQRAEVWKAWSKLPVSFGSNASGLAQRLGLRAEQEETIEGFTP